MFIYGINSLNPLFILSVTKFWTVPESASACSTSYTRDLLLFLQLHLKQFIVPIAFYYVIVDR